MLTKDENAALAEYTLLCMLQRGLRRMSATTLESASITRLKQLDSADSDTQNMSHQHPHSQQQQQQQQQSAAVARLLQAVHLIAVKLSHLLHLRYSIFVCFIPCGDISFTVC